jgi:hypothetical protein
MNYLAYHYICFLKIKGCDTFSNIVTHHHSTEQWLPYAINSSQETKQQIPTALCTTMVV